MAKRGLTADAWSINDILAHLRACEDVLADREGAQSTDLDDEDGLPHMGVRPGPGGIPDAAGRTPGGPGSIPVEAWERTARVTGLVGGAAPRSARYYGDRLAGHERTPVEHIGRIARALLDAPAAGRI